MNWLGLVFTSMFVSNSLLMWGFGARASFRPEGTRTAPWLVSLLFLNLLASASLWLLLKFVLGPLGLERLVVIVYLLVLVPILRFASRGIGGLSGFKPRAFFAGIDELTLSTLVFGISLLATRGASSFVECLVASLASVLGWWGAVSLLGAVTRRTESGPLPALLKGAPIYLLSAALMAMLVSFAGSVVAVGIGK